MFAIIIRTIPTYFIKHTEVSNVAKVINRRKSSLPEAIAVTG